MFIVVSRYIKKERLQINNLSLQLKELAKGEQNKLRAGGAGGGG